MMREQPVVTVREFAKLFQISETSARNIFRASKTMRAYQVGGKWVCDYDDFLLFKERLKVTKNVSLCMSISVDVFSQQEPENPDMKLLLLNGASPDVIEEVIYGKTEETDKRDNGQ